MARRGKQYREMVKKVDRLNKYGFKEAVQRALDCSYGKFDETVEISVRLGVDPRHACMNVLGIVTMPYA